MIKDPPSKRVNCFTSNDKYLISGHGSPGEIRVWLKSSMTLKQTINTMNDVKSLAINNKLLVCSLKDQIMIFNLENFNLVKETKENGREVNSVKLYSDYIIYCARDKIKVINSKDFQLITEINFKN